MVAICTGWPQKVSHCQESSLNRIKTVSAATSELDMDWIHPWIGLGWIGLDWIGSGFRGNFVDWIGLGPMTAIICFFSIYIFSILTTDKR